MATNLRLRKGGVLPVDKPSGPTSHQVVARARKALATRRVGHTGTLDPFASGLLLLCIDAATRLSEYLTGLDKTYDATAVLGERTDTLDPEGRVVERDDIWRSLPVERIESVLAGFVGEIRQVPPQFSAKKIEGESMYRKARRGESVTLEAVPVTIRSLELSQVELPFVRFRVRCSSGTYVRGLARDIGSALGTCAYLTELRRTGIGRFDVTEALTPDDLGSRERVAAAWISPAQAVAHLPTVDVDEAVAGRLALGQAVPLAELGEARELAGLPEGPPVSIRLGSGLLAVGEREDDLLRPRKVFARV